MIRYDWLSKWSEYAEDKIAVLEYETGRKFSYGQLNRIASVLSEKLTTEYHLTKGDRLALLAENCLEHFILFFAAQKTGIIIVPLNYRLSPRELDIQLHDSQPQVFIVESQFADKTKALSFMIEKDPFWALEDLQEFVSSSIDSKLDFPSIETLEEDDPVFLLYTSGSTGVPKGVLYTHKMLFWNSLNTSMRLDITSSDRSVSCMPLFHTGGWNVIPTPFFHRGAFVCLMKTFDASLVLELLERESATMFVAVPTMLQLMAQSERFDSSNLEELRYFIIGGEPMPLPLIDKWDKKGIPSRQGFGLTEVGPSVTSLHQDDAIRKMGSIGKPNFYIDINIIREDGKDCRINEIGELLLKGPTVTPGYWQNSEQTAEAITDGWFHTGDLVRQDAEGYLFVMDRKKNMFISGGENVYPAEVEKFLHNHHAIKDIAIIGVPDPKWGEVGKAFIVQTKTGTLLGEEELIEHCRGELATYKIPRLFHFIDELPLNDAGKIDRKKLRSIHEHHNQNV